jgi:hypothetical protein
VILYTIGYDTLATLNIFLLCTNDVHVCTFMMLIALVNGLVSVVGEMIFYVKLSYFHNCHSENSYFVRCILSNYEVRYDGVLYFIHYAYILKLKFFKNDYLFVFSSTTVIHSFHPSLSCKMY